MNENWDLLGHEWAVQMLRQHITHASARHAYLFCGPPGVGRRTLALRLTQALNCPQPLSPGQPCGTCRTCQQIERLQYPDLAIVQSDKQGGILKVEQIRAIRQSLVLKPYQGIYRVALFLRFHEANPNAANALLKTLEEAPAHVILILTADNPEQLLPTIVSRCEVLRLRPLPFGKLETYLKTQTGEAVDCHLLAHISGGRPGYAMRLLQEQDPLQFRSQRLDDLQRLLHASRVVRFAFAEKLTDRKADLKERFRETLLLWLSFWRDVLLCASGDSSALANVDRMDEIEALAALLTRTVAYKLVRGAEAALYQLERNVNSRLLAEVLFLDWPKL